MNSQERAYQFEGSQAGTRWLLCLFTYNRPALLDNCIRSIEQFVPKHVERRIYDDGSPDASSFRYTRYGYSVHYTNNRGGQYGGFYRNMKLALDYAVAGAYDRCLFFEDDEQFVAPLDLGGIDHIFRTCPDAVQVNPLFLRRAYPYRGKLQWIEKANAYKTERAFNTTGIWNLDLVKLKRFQFIDEFPDGLPPNSAWWLRQDFRLYQMGQPCAVVVPPGLSGVNVYGIPAKDPARCLPWQEHITEEPGLVWHQPKMRRRLYELCAQTLEQERDFGGLDWSMSIDSLDSHMTWKPGTPQAGWRSKLPWWMVEARHFNLRHYLAYRQLSELLEAERGERFNDRTCSTYHGGSNG